MSLSLAQGRLFGALFESMLFGINFILFLALGYLTFRREGPGQRRVVSPQHAAGFGVVTAVFVLCAAHLAAVMRQLYVAFFVSDLPPDVFYLDHTQPTDLIQKSVYAAATALADGILIYRAYIIFDQRWPAILAPTLTLCATVGLWAALIREYRVSPPGTILFPPPVKRLVVLSYTMSFITNTIITTMITVRLWLVIRRFRNMQHQKFASHMKLFLAPFVESGVIYPLALLINAIFLATKNNGLEILSGSTTQILGIVPLMLTLQLRLNLSTYEDETTATRRTSTTANVDVVRSSVHFRHGGQPETVSLDMSDLDSDTRAGSSTKYTSSSG
ncbi:hypothetical protein MIND_00590800 [Mycena indigotica]|uniref:Uncharacterized protein n=1 Tax=Mycena indigotica TaxID=2126181 RepID=A0A8H6SRB4_9AGAR|nr:uncharacterized protein MIND_00590800 [Mycena indigotica]KAF7303615.1 hypothetical protein MIND_00590800 [Mycena indigotica]